MLTLCGKCEVPLTGDNQPPSARRRGQRICSTCHSARSRFYRKRVGGYRYTGTDVRKQTLVAAKARAKKRGLEFSLTLETCPEIPDKCPVLGIPLAFVKGLGSGKWTHGTPSLDRIDNTRGYTPDNVIWVSCRANALKKDATVEELQMLAAFYSKLADSLSAVALEA